MKKPLRNALLAGFAALVCLPAAARAEPKPWIWSWGPTHWENLDFVPYLETPRHPHNTQWDASKWEPNHWVSQTDNYDGRKLVRDFYFADILRDQYMKRGVPVVEVGPGFYQLGGQDKRRVMETLDYIYGVTNARDNGMFMLYDWATKKAVGIYTKHGLQIQ